MKHFIIKMFLGMALMSPLWSYSQIRFGVKGDFQITNVSKIHWDSESRKAIALGAFAQIPIGEDNQFFIQPELLYSMQGERDLGDKYNLPVKKYFQNYINIPVMFRAYFSEADNEFFAELGPQFGFLVNQSNKEADEKYYSKVKTFDASIGIGIGYSLMRQYEIFARYNYGLVDAYKDYEGKQKTSVLAFGLAYIF